MILSKTLDTAMSMADGKGETSNKLEILIGGKNIEPGQYVPKADAKTIPELKLSTSGGNGPYVGICLDLDAPFKSLSFLGPILHWAQPEMTLEGTDDIKTLVATSNPPIAEYAGPGPPPGAAPHRYVFFVYEQPSDFDEKKFAPPPGQTYSVGKRMRFDMDSFAKEAKFGPIIAANYFTSN